MQGITMTAIGGGGFTNETHSMLDDFCLRQAGQTKPRLGFIGTASNDDPLKVARFHARFAGETTSHVHLPMKLDAQSLADKLNALDMIYVGGGDTEKMVALWRSNDCDGVLCDAARASRGRSKCRRRLLVRPLLVSLRQWPHAPAERLGADKGRRLPALFNGNRQTTGATPRGCGAHYA